MRCIATPALLILLAICLHPLSLHGRELVVDIGERDTDAWQHLGLGEKMVSAASEIGKADFEASHLLVNSGIGVKEYYRGLGFTDKGPYLLRNL